MNRPIRTLAVGCLLLFAALLINVNYVQVIKADDLNDAGRQQARPRRGVLARARPDPRRRRAGRAQRAESTTAWSSSAATPTGSCTRTVTGFFSCIYGTSGIENTENSLLSGSDERLFVNRMIDLVGNEQPKGGSVPLTIDPKAQQAAARRARRTCRRSTDRPRVRSSRSTRRPARSWRWSPSRRTTPT